MTREEAIKILSKDTSLATVNELKYYSGFNQEKVVGLIQEAMDMGAKALEKQIPKKQDKFGCPNCHTLLNIQKYCHECGQALDWSEE